MVQAIRPVADRTDESPADPIQGGQTGGGRLTLAHVWASLPVLIPMIVSLATQMVAIDLAYNIRAGDLILDAWAVPRTDTFTFTVAGKLWMDQQWGAQLLMAAAHRAGGFATVAVLRAGLIAASFGLLYLACRARGARPPAASLLSLAGFLAFMQTLSMRPQLFALPLFAASLWIVFGRRAHPGRLWLLPVIAALWANLHGSFVLVPLVLGLALVEDAHARDPGARRTLVVGALAVLMPLVNPFGPSVWRYVANLSTDPYVRTTVAEWAPLSVSSFAELMFFASALAIAGLLARRREPAPWPALAWLGVFFLMALPARRGVVWWAFVAPAMTAGLLQLKSVRRVADAGSPRWNLAIVAALGLTAIALLPWWHGPAPGALLLEAPRGLAAATDRALPDGSRLVVPQPWGSWFEYAVPSMPVFVDPRIELFPPQVWRDYAELRSAGDAWRDVLDRWEADAIVVDRRDWPLLPIIREDPGWRLAYEDGDGALFVRA